MPEQASLFHDSPETKVQPEEPRAVSFPLGQMCITASIAHGCNENEYFRQFVQSCLARHARGDWGDLSENDRKENEWSLKNGERLLSSYNHPDHRKVWVITERDRSVTTILYPEDY